jgi:hypothetical protein
MLQTAVCEIRCSITLGEHSPSFFFDYKCLATRILPDSVTKVAASAFSLSAVTSIVGSDGKVSTDLVIHGQIVTKGLTP